MILYGSSISPFVRKVVAFAAEKGIDLEHRPLGLGSNDPDFRRASPFRKIPALVDGDFMLSDSSAIVHYLEALQPEPNLLPSEPRARGRAIWWDEWADTMLIACGGKMFFNRFVAPRFMGRPGDTAMADAAERNELPPILDCFEREAPENGFLVEDRLTLADISVASPFANFDLIEMDLARWPKTKAYAERILARPSFATAIAADKAMVAALPPVAA